VAGPLATTNGGTSALPGAAAAAAACWSAECGPWLGSAEGASTPLLSGAAVWRSAVCAGSASAAKGPADPRAAPGAAADAATAAVVVSRAPGPAGSMLSWKGTASSAGSRPSTMAATSSMRSAAPLRPSETFCQTLQVWCCTAGSGIEHAGHSHSMSMSRQLWCQRMHAYEYSERSHMRLFGRLHDGCFGLLLKRHASWTGAPGVPAAQQALLAVQRDQARPQRLLVQRRAQPRTQSLACVCNRSSALLLRQITRSGSISMRLSVTPS
jgi:hypothetical protein